ncbi:replication protein [Escherichia coli]|uniref:Replication protein n=1 Tax=Escherichia coli TaxID=562 RepID=A0A376KXM5_ECOLX|nr:replication protein [Escherichia coli]
MVHGEKNTMNQAGDVQTVNSGQPAGTTPEADSAYALKADSGAVQQAMTAGSEQSHQLQQPEADSRHSAGSRSGSPGKHRAACGTSGLSGCVRTGLAGIPVACRGKPEEIRIQCLEGQIARGGATRGHAGWCEALHKIPGCYRESGNGICSASDDVFWTGPEF